MPTYTINRHSAAKKHKAKNGGAYGGGQQDKLLRQITSDSDGSSLSVQLRIRGNPPCKTWNSSILSNELWAHTRPASDMAGVFKKRAEKPLDKSRLSQNTKGKGLDLRLMLIKKPLEMF